MQICERPRTFSRLEAVNSLYQEDLLKSEKYICGAYKYCMSRYNCGVLAQLEGAQDSLYSSVGGHVGPMRCTR